MKSKGEVIIQPLSGKWTETDKFIIIKDSILFSNRFGIEDTKELLLFLENINKCVEFNE